MAESWNAANKRRRDDHDEVEPSKAGFSRHKKPRAVDESDSEQEGELPALNTRPSRKLDIFVFGTGNFGELGLGWQTFAGESLEEAVQPRLNPHLLAKRVGVVQVACGGMHVVALTDDNRVLTWGANDDMALGRETYEESDSDSDSDDDDYDADLNHSESVPGDVDFSLIDAAKFVQVAATDSASFVLCDDGLVYGWGTFRASGGILGFTQDIEYQQTPRLIAGLKNITSLVGGSNHMLALDKDGRVWTWGSGGQSQLGRKHIARRPKATLTPRLCNRFTKSHYAVTIAAGSHHSFYIDNKGVLWSWGLNNYAQTGHVGGSCQADSVIPSATKVPGLRNITHVDGGEHHSAACGADGELFTWGRIDNFQAGLSRDVFTEENATFDKVGRPKCLLQPTALPDLNASFVAIGSDTTLAIAADGRVYTWGSSHNWQAGHGSRDSVELPTAIEAHDIRGKKLVWAGAGDNYSIVAAAPYPG